jgi:hypothetical protein
MSGPIPTQNQNKLAIQWFIELFIGYTKGNLHKGK